MAAGPVRTITFLPTDEALAYECAVARIAPQIEAGLGPEVIAHRVVLADPHRPELRLEPWPTARSRFHARLRRAVAGARLVVMADVRACYASIGPEVVRRALCELGCAPAPVAEVVELLRGFAARGIPGLPIGPDPSAVLANAVLSSVDRALAEAGAAHLRWVDDVIAVPSVFDAGRVLDVLRRSLAELGLELSERKTRVVIDPRGLAARVPDLVPSGLRGATLRGDAHPVPGVPGPHARASEDGGVGPRRRSARPAGRRG